MIKRISYIKNLATFKNFEWIKSVRNTNQVFDFEKINILYGRNYSGKTTLSRIIRAMETGKISEKYELPKFEVVFKDGNLITESQIESCEKSIRVFNEDFVKENLSFLRDDDGDIKPFAILGDDNIKIEEEIKRIKKILGSNEIEKETGLYKQNTDAKKDYDEIYNRYEKETSDLEKKLKDKATNKIIGIKYKPEKFGDVNYNIIKLQEDIKIVLSENFVDIGTEEEKRLEILLKETTKEEIIGIEMPKLMWSDVLTKTKEVVSRKIGASNKITELLHNIALNKWVKQGTELLKGKNICAFCGNEISDDRWVQLNAHFDEESKKLEEDINKILEKIQNEKDIIEKSFKIDKTKFYSKYNEELLNLEKRYLEAESEYIKELMNLEEALNKRKDKIIYPFVLGVVQDKSNLVQNIFDDYDIIRKQSNSYSAKLKAEQTVAKVKLRLHEAKNYCLLINYKEISQELENLRKLKIAQNEIYIKILTDITNYENEVKTKKHLMQDEGKGAVQVDKYLKNYFGHQYLSLKAVKSESDLSVNFKIIRDGKQAYNLSEGECNLIAFCYFMAKLKDIDTNGIKPIIWIDDPISSLDGNHIFFVFSLIAAEIVDKDIYDQLFVSTHNLDFLNYLNRLGNKRQRQYFLIDRIGLFSDIQNMPQYLEKNATEFNYLFKNIYLCATSEIDDTNYEQFYNLGNNARKFLDILLFFKYPDDSKDKLKRFFGESKIPVFLTKQIDNEYSHLNSLERASKPIEVPEMQTAAKLIITKLKEDKEQFAALCNSVGITV
ncbi:MAG: AAA family ATPase [Clostridia bacterium]